MDNDNNVSNTGTGSSGAGSALVHRKPLESISLNTLSPRSNGSNGNNSDIKAGIIGNAKNTSIIKKLTFHGLDDPIEELASKKSSTTPTTTDDGVLTVETECGGKEFLTTTDVENNEQGGITQENISDLLTKPITFDSPNSSFILKSVDALTFISPDNGTEQSCPGSFKRPSEAIWDLDNASPTSSRASKRVKSCNDVLDEDKQESIINKSLIKSQSDPAAILRAIQQSDTDPLLIGDSSKHYVLPILSNGKHSDLKEISPETLSQVIKGDYVDKLDSYHIIDCRYPFEFDGGHIDGALNLYTQKQVYEKYLIKLPSEPVTGKRNILIFHCEFSSQRAPNMCRYVRDFDRNLNKDNYPALHYPEMYILHGGYKSFFETMPSQCTPSCYVTMIDEMYSAELSFFKNKTKEEMIKGNTSFQMSSYHLKTRKTKSFNRLYF